MKNVTPINFDNYKSITANYHADNVSSRYSFISTMVVVEALQAMGWLPVKAEEQNIKQIVKSKDGYFVENKRYGFQKHMIRFRSKELEPINLRGDGKYQEIDTIFPEIVLTNSHDGSASFNFSLGLLRQVCANGLVVSEASLNNVSVKHIGYTDNAVKTIVGDVVRIVPSIAKNVESFNSTILTKQEALAFGKSALTLKYGNDTDEIGNYDISLLVYPNRVVDSTPTLWSVFNIVQEKLIERGGRFKRTNNSYRRFKKTKGVKAISRNINLNKAFWVLAEELKTIKEQGVAC